jgi:hypothetical protein
MPGRLAVVVPLVLLLLVIADYGHVTCFQPPFAARAYRPNGATRSFLSDRAVHLPSESYDSQTFLHAIQELNYHLLHYQEAKLLALEELNYLLKELVALKEAYGTIYVAEAQAQDVIIRAVDQIEKVENNFLYFWSTPAATTTHRSPILNTEAASDPWPDQHAVHPTGFAEQRDATFPLKQGNQNQNQKKIPKVPARLYRYAVPTEPVTNPGLPNYLGDTLYANLKVAQPALTSEFENIMTSVTKNPSIFETLKKNQPIFAAEFQQFLVNLKQSQPIFAAKLEQLFVAIKQNQPILKQMKQNQPAFSAELEQILYNLKQNQPMFSAELEQLIVNLKQNQPIFTAEVEQLLVNLMQNQPILTAELSQMIVDIKQALVALGGTVI